MGDSIAPELVARMVAMIERQAADWSYMADGRSFNAEARAIWAEIRRTQDPDRADAERIAAGFCGGANVDAVLNGIKHGRELAQGPRS